MRLGDFAVVVVCEGRPRHADAAGYVALEHGETYALALFNASPHWPCDARVTIDGTHVGTIRLEAGGRGTLERPVDVARKFTFFRANTPEGNAAGVGAAGADVTGLVSVKFTPGYVVVVQHVVAPSIMPLLRSGDGGRYGGAFGGFGGGGVWVRGLLAGFGSASFFS